MRFWYPVYTHPAGPSPRPWYRVLGSFVFRTPHHPCGESAEPNYRIAGADVYEADASAVAVAETAAPSFVLRGSMLYPADAHASEASYGPWYQMR